MDLIIKPLSPSYMDDYLSLFDNMVFSENPDWSKCYCYSYHFTGAKEDWTKEKNRSAVIELIEDDKMRGYLAYEKDKPVGWCNANNKNNYQTFDKENLSPPNVCSIVCFLISPAYRRKGIAQKILETICKDYTIKGYDYIEAYPRKDQHSCEMSYHGHLSLYEKYNFKIEREYNEHYIVRKRLKDRTKHL